MLCPSARHFLLCSVLAQPRKGSNMTEKLAVQNQHKQENRVGTRSEASCQLIWSATLFYKEDI